MTDLRKAAQQALEALEEYQYHGAPFLACDGAVAALRAALAQQKDLTDPGNDVDVLREHVRHLERRVRELHAQQAEPVAGVVLNEEGRAALVEHGREEWHCVSRNARRLYAAPPQRKPQTLDEALTLPRAMAQAYETGYKAGVAHERERCLRLIDDHVRAVDSEDVVRAIKEVQG